MQTEALKRVTDYIDTLKESGAPHQQELAKDLSEVMRGANPPIDDRDAQIEQLKANVSQLMDERDAARAELKKLQGHGAAKNVPEEEHANLKSKTVVGTRTSAAKHK